MAILSVPPTVYAHDMKKKKYGVSQYEADYQLGNANPYKVIGDAIREIVKAIPNDINITINVNSSGEGEIKSPMIKVFEQ